MRTNASSPLADEREDARGQTYVLTPLVGASENAESGAFALRLLEGLWRRRLWILGGTLTATILVFLVSLLIPDPYQARATLLILPPLFSADLQPPALSIDTYQSIALSKAIEKRLRERLGGERWNSLSTQVYSKRQPTEGFLPLLDLVVDADSPQDASETASAWVEIVLADVKDLSVQTKERSVSFIEQEYPELGNRLNVAEEELTTLKNSYATRLAALNDKFDERIALFQAKWNLNAMGQELETLQAFLTDSQNGLLARLRDTQLRVKETEELRTQLRQELQKQPQRIILSKAITDDQLWAKLEGDSEGKIPTGLESLRLRSEEINPVHESLAQRLAQIEVEYQSLVPQEAFLAKQVDDLRKRIAELNSALAEKSLELQRLKDQRALQVQLLERERDVAVGLQDRRVDMARKSYAKLADRYEDARLAKVQEPGEVRLLAPAVEPVKPLRRGTILFTSAAFVASLLVSTLLALLAELLRPASN